MGTGGDDLDEDLNSDIPFRYRKRCGSQVDLRKIIEYIEDKKY